MCQDIALEELESYLDMFDRAKVLETELEEAFDASQGDLAELTEAKEFLAERHADYFCHGHTDALRAKLFAVINI